MRFTLNIYETTTPKTGGIYTYIHIQRATRFSFCPNNNYLKIEAAQMFGLDFSAANAQTWPQCCFLIELKVIREWIYIWRTRDELTTTVWYISRRG